MPKPNNPFVFNDESILNSYGFRILTGGISLVRFNANPVMLDQHYNSTWAVIGKWIDVKNVEGLLMGSPVFDTADDDAKKIEGKVERGFIKAASMGISFDREDLQMVDEILTLVRCELYEVSIVAIPSNANAIRLYAQNGELMKEEDVKSLCLSVTEKLNGIPENLNSKTDMKKIILSVATLMALGFDDQPTDGLDVASVEAKVLGLSKQVADLTAKNKGLELAAQTAKEAHEAAVKLAANQKVDLAITQGKIPADKKEAFVQLGITSPEVLETTLASIPAKKDFAAGITVPGGNGAVGVKTMDEFEKLSHTEKLSFKETSPEAYKKLFNQ